MPIPVSMDPGTEIAVVRVTNGGQEKVTLQGEALVWSQDGIGSDVYAPSSELVFFPRIFSLEKGEERSVRVGYQGRGARDRERTFRLVLQELPVKGSGERAVRMTLRMSVPVFVRPEREVAGTAVERAWLEDGTVRVTVKNGGNVHAFVKRIRATGLDASGAEVFSRELRGWYVLSGASSTFYAELDEAECRAARTVRIAVTSEDATHEASAAPDPSACVRHAGR